MDNYTRLLHRAVHERKVKGFVQFETRIELDDYNDTASWERDVKYIEEGLTHA